MKGFLAALLLLFPSLALSQTAEEMASSCKAISNAKVTGAGIEMPTDFDSGACWGAFGMVQIMTNMIYMDSLGKSRFFFDICAPGDSTRTQLIKVFEQYAAQHPERVSEDFWVVAQDSLRQSFPCKK